MLKMNEDLEGALKEFLMLLDKEEYFEAHEVLEEAWHPLRKENHHSKNLVKGLINGAIAFEHIKRNKNEAHQKAKKVMVSFDRYKGICRENVEYYELFKESTLKVEMLKLKYAM